MPAKNNSKNTRDNSELIKDNSGNKSEFQKYRERRGNWFCYRCGRLLTREEPHHRLSTRKVYCMPCWEDSFIE